MITVYSGDREQVLKLPNVDSFTDEILNDKVKINNKWYNIVYTDKKLSKNYTVEQLKNQSKKRGCKNGSS